MVTSPSGSSCCTDRLARRRTRPRRGGCRTGGRRATAARPRRCGSARRGGANRPNGVSRLAPSPPTLDVEDVHVRRADLARDIAVGRPLVEIVGRALLDDAAVAQDGDLLAHRQRLELVGRRIDDRHAELAVQPLELGAHVVPQLGVEIGERLVEQQELRPADQRAAERDPLLLAARKRRRLLLEPMRELAASRPSRAPAGRCRPTGRRPRSTDRRGS